LSGTPIFGWNFLEYTPVSRTLSHFLITASTWATSFGLEQTFGTSPLSVNLSPPIHTSQWRDWCRRVSVRFNEVYLIKQTITRVNSSLNPLTESSGLCFNIAICWIRKQFPFMSVLMNYLLAYLMKLSVKQRQIMGLLLHNVLERIWKKEIVAFWGNCPVIP
jgi:hypothetical protein